MASVDSMDGMAYTPDPHGGKNAGRLVSGQGHLEREVHPLHIKFQCPQCLGVTTVNVWMGPPRCAKDQVFMQAVAIA